MNLLLTRTISISQVKAGDIVLIKPYTGGIKVISIYTGQYITQTTVITEDGIERTFPSTHKVEVATGAIDLL